MSQAGAVPPAWILSLAGGRESELLFITSVVNIVCCCKILKLRGYLLLQLSKNCLLQGGESGGKDQLK
jgi:hypothetical protein